PQCARAQNTAGRGGGNSTTAATKKPTAAKAPAKATGPEPVWPVAATPIPLEGSILPSKRIVAFYGNPLVKGMGVLGEYPPDQMLAKLDTAVARWRAADPTTPVQPALHLVACVAKDSAGKDGKYRQRADTGLIEKVYGWAHGRGAILFLDVQVGQSSLKDELPRLFPFLIRPDVHLGIDPEFSMKHGEVPGTKIGTFDAADVNYVVHILDSLVTANDLPPKVLVVHRFKEDMLTGYRRIALDPKVQIVIDMDGWGPPAQKVDSYRRYVYQYPVEYTGFKIFFHNDARSGTPLMTPADVLALFPKPLYIQYQ
ncbi:MAG TPA: hypothetical protein VMH39_07275, partial [Gemmatimonadaceae bacterium]|nr:hypothetical protein [Gemmatimonadaceae bacterium]